MIQTTFDLNIALSVAEGAARAAGALAREAFRRPRPAEDKGVNDLVTATDRANEALIVGILRTAFPTHRIAGEEGTRITGAIPADAPTWWIDPIDGTYNFVHGVPRFTVSIGCVSATGEILLGVVYDPNMDECFTAIQGDGAFCNGVAISVSKTAQLRSALAASGFPSNLRTENNNTREWSAFVPRCQGMARMGSAALDLCYVASGRFDLYWEFGLATWDICAGVLIAREAGGRVTDYAGDAHNINGGGELLATNGLLHTEAVELLQSVRTPVELLSYRPDAKALGPNQSQGDLHGK